MSNKLHKGVASFVASTTILWSMGASLITGLVTPAVALAEAGDIIKGPTSGTVYVILSDGESICSLTSPDHYVMWSKFRAKGLKMWEDIMTVDTSTYTDKGVCGLRVGSLVRTRENPEVFVIQPGMTKRGFDAWETFTGVGYGSAGVFYVTDAVLGAYSTGNKLTSATKASEIREGQLVKYADSKTVYYVGKSGDALEKKEIVNEEAFFGNFGGVWKAVVTIPAGETYTTSASQITGPDTSINRPTAVTTTVTPPGGTIAVSLASDTPSGTLAPTKSYGNVFTKINLSAGSDTTITSITVTREGLGARGDFAAVYLYVDGVKYTTARTFNSDDRALFSLGSGLMLKANTPRSLAIVSDMAAIAATGQHKLGIKAASDIATNGTVSGTFPLMGNFVSTSTTSVGELIITAQGISDTEIFVGEQQQELARFQFISGSAEKVRLNSIRFRNIGSVKVSEYANFALYKGGSKLAGIEFVTNGDYITAKNINLTMEKSETLLFKLYGDVVGGANSTIQFSIEEAADVNATGLSYGYGVTINNATGGTTWAEQKSHTSAVTVLAGELTFAQSGPAAYSIDKKKDDIIIANLAITAPAGETITITRMYAYIEGTEVSASTKNLQDTVENIQLVQKTGGNQVIDATTSDGTSNDNDSFYFANFDVKGATTWDVVFDTNDSEARATDKFRFIMIADDDSATVGDNTSVTPVEAKNSSGKSLTSGTRDDIKPAAQITGNYVTLQDVDLTVTNVSMDAETVVAKQQNIPLIKLQLVGGTAGDVKITQMVFEDVSGTNTADGTNDTSNFSIYEIMSDGKETLLQSGKSASSATDDFEVTFNSLNNGAGVVVKANETKTVVVKADLTSGITSGEILAIAAKADGIVAEKVADGNTLADSAIIGNDTAINGRSVTAQASGQLTISLDENNTTNAPSTQVLAGTSGINTMYIKFNADFENVYLKKLVLDHVNSGAADSVAAVHLYDGTTKVLTATYAESTAEATFGNGQDIFYTFDKDVDKVLKVVTDLRAIGAGSKTADSGDKIQWRIDAETAADTNDSVTATGVASSSDLTYTTTRSTSKKLFSTGSTQADVDSNTFQVRRSLITDITALKLGTSTPVDGSTQTLTNGSGVEIFRFKVTAAADTGGNENDAVDITDIDLTLSAASVTVSSVIIYSLDDTNTTVSASTTTLTDTRITFASASLPNIEPGSSATLVVEATIADASGGESVQVSIGSLGAIGTEATTDLSTGSGDIVWSDNNDSTTDAKTSFVSWPGIKINKVIGQTRVYPAT